MSQDTRNNNDDTRRQSAAEYGTVIPGTLNPGTIPFPQANQDTSPSPNQGTRPDDGPELVELVGYRKFGLLGEGSYGEVWKALAPGGVEVALKIIIQPLTHAAARRELKALDKVRRLHHPFLLQTHSFGLFEERLSIVMELAEGSLADRFEHRRAEWTATHPSEDLLTFFTQAADALDYLQAQQITHRDIKPENILYLQGFAKVADFGLARGQEQGIVEASGCLGTPCYMAPELWKQTVSRTTDQYSLAATYAQMRLGHPVFQGTFHEVFMQHLERDPELGSLGQPEQLVLKKALAKDPDDRFPSCVAFVHALQEAARPTADVTKFSALAGTTLPQPARPTQTATTPSRTKWPLAVSLVTLLLLALALGYAFWPRPPAAAWLPRGWAPAEGATLTTDGGGRLYYNRLTRTFGGVPVTLVLIPRLGSNDPPTFYMMENKVWNSLYEKFMADPRTPARFQTYSERPGCSALVSQDPNEWRYGASPQKSGKPGTPPANLPVFRVTVTEAHCFAEWLGGRLPSRKQWIKASGADEPPEGETPAVGPFAGSATPNDIAVGQQAPWPVDRGDRDVSRFGVRQMAGNGREWTRDVQEGSNATIPLESMLAPLKVFVLGRFFDSASPLTFRDMRAIPFVEYCTKADFRITFRVVVEE